MSFNQLPSETLQLIVDFCRDADLAYQARRGGAGTGSERARWRGRSLSALSRTSKSLRALSFKYIFETLRSDRCPSPIFQYSILGSPLVSFITHLSLAAAVGGESGVDSLIHLVVHVLPHLPHLSRISGLHRKHLRVLVGQTDLISPIKRCSPQITRTRAILLKVAENVDSWEVAIDAANLEGLVSRNPGGIRSLELESAQSAQSAQLGAIRYLNSDESSFPAVLAKLANLQSLSVAEAPKISSDDGLYSYRIALETSYAFADSLRSLCLTLPSNDPVPGIDFLRFAELFPLLERFTLAVRFNEFSWSEPTRRAKLPNVRYLRFERVDIEALILLLPCLDLPSIRSISFRGTRSRSTDVESHQRRIGRIFRILSDSSTLRELDMTYIGNISSTTLRTTQALLASTVTFTFPLQWNISDKEYGICSSDDAWASFHSSGDEREKEEEEEARPRPTFDPFYEKTDRILSWAREQAERTKGGDFVAGKELSKLLEPVEALRRWMQD